MTSKGDRYNNAFVDGAGEIMGRLQGAYIERYEHDRVVVTQECHCLLPEKNFSNETFRGCDFTNEPANVAHCRSYAQT